MHAAAGSRTRILLGLVRIGLLGVEVLLDKGRQQRQRHGPVRLQLQRLQRTRVCTLGYQTLHSLRDRMIESRQRASLLDHGLERLGHRCTPSARQSSTSARHGWLL